MHEFIEKIEITFPDISIYNNVVYNNDTDRGVLIVQRGEIKCLLVNGLRTPHSYKTFFWAENKFYQVKKANNLPYEYEPVDASNMNSLFDSKFQQRDEYNLCKNELQLIYEFLDRWTKIKYKNLPVDSIEYIEKQICNKRWIEEQDRPQKINIRWHELVYDDEFKSMQHNESQENRIYADDRFGLSKEGKFLWDFEISLIPTLYDNSVFSSFNIICTIQGDWWSGRDHFRSSISYGGKEEIFWLYLKKETDEIIVRDPSNNNLQLSSLLDRISKQIEIQGDRLHVVYGI